MFLKSPYAVKIMDGEVIHPLKANAQFKSKNSLTFFLKDKQ